VKNRSPCFSPSRRRGAGGATKWDRTSYADPEITAFINDRFVPIRVDADDRPDISERYSLGGWPTTAFLTPAGEILAGGTFVPIDRMQGVLTQVSEAFRSQPDRKAPPGTDDATRSAIGVLDQAQLTSRVFATFDEEFGGFGTEPKFPHVAPLRLALDLFTESHDVSLERMILVSLDRIGWGGLYDAVDGGFFRYATTRDWQLPHVENCSTSMRRWRACFWRRARNYRFHASQNAPATRFAIYRTGLPTRLTVGGTGLRTPTRRTTRPTPMTRDGR
jgi:hypothetical protein